jgi:hypothetical protein
MQKAALTQIEWYWWFAETDRTELVELQQCRKAKKLASDRSLIIETEELHAQFSVRVEKGFYFLGIVVIMCIYLDQNHFV